MDYLEQLSKTKSKCLLNLNPFYSSVIVAIKYKFVSDKSITAHTNGVSVTIGEQFWDKLNSKERIFLVLHEISHIILDHVGRGKRFRNNMMKLQIWFLACDYFINLTLVDDNTNNKYQFIKNGLLNKKYKDMSTDEIYKKLIEEQKNNPRKIQLLIESEQPLKDDMEMSSGSDSSGSDEYKEEEAKVRSIVKSAISQNRNQKFSNSSSFMSELELLLDPPKVNWKTLLSRYMHMKFKKGKNYARPHRRTMFNKKLYIKTYKTDVKLGDLLVYIDVSGSCTVEDITNMASELKHIVAQYKPDSIVFSSFNTAICETVVINSLEDVPTKMRISGGTNVQSCIDHINNHKSRVCLSVIMSDFYTPAFNEPENVPLLMLAINNPTYDPGFGTVINYDEET